MKHAFQASRPAPDFSSVAARTWAVLAAALAGFSHSASAADAQGMSVASGQATATQVGAQLNVTASHNAVLDWRSFNIGAGETANFLQPSRTSIVWNRIHDQNPSQILGNLNANGYVVLMNPNGFYFGPKSVINVGGLTATTVPWRPFDGGGGALWQFDGLPPAASIINHGEVRAANGGQVYLISERVENHGRIEAPEGEVKLMAGREVLVSERPDGRGLSAAVTLPAGSVDNLGTILADAGRIALHARVVNQGGVAQANSVRERNGVIELVAEESVTLGENSLTSARGDAAGSSAGGEVIVKSKGSFADAATAIVDVRGGAVGGDGGFVEISATALPAIQSMVRGEAAAGSRGGALLIDPTDIVLGSSGSGSAPGGTVNSADGSGTLNLNVNSAFLGFSQITLQATRDILFGSSVIWNLANSTGISDPGSKLTLQAGRNIVFNNGSGLVLGAGWAADLVAGATFATATAVAAGTGGIYLGGSATGTGNGSIRSLDSLLRLFAGNEATVGSGFIRSEGGGSIEITTVSGDVRAGTKSHTYDFTRSGYALSAQGVGGIATVAGGNVNITAGRDIISSQPTSGALGAEAGDVTLTAAQRVIGSYIVRNGSGRITAQQGSVGTASEPLTLSLISGGWEVNAPLGSIFMNEVRNPNGVFNGNTIRGSFNGRAILPEESIPQLFDYAPDAFARFTAGNSVQFLGSNLPRPAAKLPPIFPSRLEVSAGAGGVVLGNEVQLFPSPLGSLRITTTDGGSLRSAAGAFYQLVMSDSGDLRYTTFANGHAATPLHLNNAESVTLNISGDIQNLFLRVPKKAEIIVAGGTLNFSFEGQNLRPTDVTRIHIAGDFNSRLNRTFVTLASPADMSVFDPVLTANPGLSGRVTYDPATQRLGLQNKMTAADLAFLLNPTVRVVNELGVQQTDENGNPLFAPAVFTADAAALQQLYAASQDIPTSALAYQGLQLGGQGRFDFRARNLNLGISQGIRSLGYALNSSLFHIVAPGLPSGAAIDVAASGAVDMAFSQIVSFGGGDITMNAGGAVNVGSQDQFTSDDVPKGIYSTAGGNVSVVAADDVNVNGSRVAAFDGGSVTVKSINGDVNAGAGGLGVIVFNRSEIDPVTQLVITKIYHLGISGIAATLFPGSAGRLGDITIEAGRDILANLGGVRQAAFGGGSGSGAKVTLIAARNINAGQSGIVGENVTLNAAGDIGGLVVAKGDLAITTPQSVSVTAVAGGSAAVSAGGTVSGTIGAGAGGISVSADSISANLSSSSVSASGDTSSAKVGVQATTQTKTEKVTTDAAETIATASTKAENKADDDEEKKKRAALAPKIMRTTGRVTVILPEKAEKK